MVQGWKPGTVLRGACPARGTLKVQVCVNWCALGVQTPAPRTQQRLARAHCGRLQWHPASCVHGELGVPNTQHTAGGARGLSLACTPQWGPWLGAKQRCQGWTCWCMGQGHACHLCAAPRALPSQGRAAPAPPGRAPPPSARGFCGHSRKQRSKVPVRGGVGRGNALHLRLGTETSQELIPSVVLTWVDSAGSWHNRARGRPGKRVRGVLGEPCPVPISTQMQAASLQLAEQPWEAAASPGIPCPAQPHRPRSLGSLHPL